ncbi:metal-dependent hydrolase [Thalassobacillus hwangdonensis]|uniref:Metal-dependent hydrolase n=1 Tax=Thalassobacillus hwangdonensis TaxID=546108 RepID=A0ABW3L529_9BACI
MYGYLLHTLLHFLAGACISYLTLVKSDDLRRKQLILLAVGGVVALLPDITKFFGDILGHSIFAAPFFGWLAAWLYRKYDKTIPYKKLWLIFTFIVIIGHLFIDYIGNGLALFFPFVRSEFDFHIIPSIDFFSLTILLIMFPLTFYFKKGKAIFITGLATIDLYLIILSVSKVQLEHELHQEYEGIELLETYPSSSDFGEWNFLLKTNVEWIRGSSPILGGGHSIEK